MDATGQGKITKVVRLFDTAVRWTDGPSASGTDARAYAASRDFELVKAVEGQRPMVFHTRRLRRSQIRDIECMSADPFKRESAFAVGVDMVDMPDGQVMRPARERWTDDELDRFDFVDIEDIGSVVLARSRLPFGSPASFAAPPSSAVALAALLYPTAAPSQSGVVIDSSKPAEPSDS